MALQASTTYAPKHLISLLCNSFDEYAFLKKETFLSKLGNQHNYQDNTIILKQTHVFFCFLWSKPFIFQKRIKTVDKIKILTTLMSLFQPIKFVVAKSYFMYCNCIILIIVLIAEL